MDQKQIDLIHRRLAEVFKNCGPDAHPWAAGETAVRAYIAGVQDGICAYAHWRDGKQYVGTCGTTLLDALKEWEIDES